MEKKIHYLKISNDFADAILMKDKLFEIRINDRGYQKGDYVKFKAIDKAGFVNQHDICNKLYLITYVMNGYGIKNGYVVFGIKESEV